jgi:hypothetical protein
MTNTPEAIAAQRAKRRANIAAGLTWDGRPRQNYQWPELDGLPRRERMNERIRLTNLRKHRARKNGGVGFVLEKRPARTAAWKTESKILRAQIESAAASLSEIFHELPPKAKARCLALADSLAQIRRGLV